MCACTGPLLDRDLGLCVSLCRNESDVVWVPPAASCVRGDGPLIPGSAGKGPGSRLGRPGPSHRVGPLVTRCSSQLPAPARGASRRRGLPPPPGPRVRSPGRSRPAGPGEPRQPPPPPLSVPPSPPSLLPPERGLRRGWEEISPEFPFHTLAAKLSFCVSPSLQSAALSSEMPGRVRGVAGCRSRGGTGGPDGLGVPGPERGRRRAGGGAPIVPLLLFVYAKLLGPLSRTQVKVKARTGRGAG